MKKVIYSFMLNIMVLTGLVAQETYFSPIIDVWGLGATSGLNLKLIDDLTTNIQLSFEGGYFTYLWAHDSSGGSLGPSPQTLPDDSYYEVIRTNSRIHLSQGIIESWGAKDPASSDFLKLLVYYQFIDFNVLTSTTSYFYNSAQPDAQGSWSNTFGVGIVLDQVMLDPIIQNREGWKLGITGEYTLVGMKPLSGNLDLDYWRLNLEAKGYFSLVKDRDVVLNYNGRLIGDVLIGASFPTQALYGITNVFYSTHISGGRGFGFTEAKVRVYSNNELDLLFPRLLGFDIIPGILLFYDHGYRDTALDYQLDFANPLATIGGAIRLNLNLFNFLKLQFSFGAQWEFARNRVNIILGFTNYL